MKGREQTGMNGKDKKIVVVRGGGDLASGTIWKLHRCGYKVLVLEINAPSAIRRNVAFSEAMYDGESKVEGIVCKKADNLEQAEVVWKEGNVPILEDSDGSLIVKIASICCGGRNFSEKKYWHFKKHGACHNCIRTRIYRRH